MPTAPYKNTILATMSELLRPVGFRKRGAIFMRTLSDVVHLIGLQSSQSSTSTCFRMTLNLAVWVPAAAEEGNKGPDILSAHWRQRIGMLMPERNDHWWVVSSEEEAKVAVQEIGHVLHAYGLPALDGLSTSEPLACLWRSGASPGLTQHLAQRYLGRLEKKAEANQPLQASAATPRG
jgi:hypothetical protein